MSIKTVLITGARSFAALDLARAFAKAGIRVICADSMKNSICRYSRLVSGFYEVASPALEFENFVSDLQDIIHLENIDLVIPTCEEIFYIAKAKDKLQAKVFSDCFEKLDTLHNKWKFYSLLREMGFETPVTHLWNGDFKPEGQWILKPIYSRFGISARIIDKKWPKCIGSISNPFIIQKYLSGETLSSYSVCIDGKVTAHVVYQGLHKMGIGAGISAQNIHDSEVDQFVHKFVKSMNFTGQIAFDFIRSEKLYCIECNPRATSGIHFFEKNEEIVSSFLRQDTLLAPKHMRIYQDLLLMLWYGTKQKEIFSFNFWKHLVVGKNPLLMRGDNCVLVGVPLIVVSAINKTLRLKSCLQKALTYDIEYNGECL